jgi:hypothetical protein
VVAAEVRQKLTRILVEAQSDQAQIAVQVWIQRQS